LKINHLATPVNSFAADRVARIFIVHITNQNGNLYSK
jgi:hypothetical protein